MIITEQLQGNCVDKVITHHWREGMDNQAYHTENYEVHKLIHVLILNVDTLRWLNGP